MKETVINNTFVPILELYDLGLTNKMCNAIILLIHSFCDLYNRIIHQRLFKVIYNNAILLKVFTYSSTQVYTHTPKELSMFDLPMCPIYKGVYAINS
jgi:hypothetical protein